MSVGQVYRREVNVVQPSGVNIGVPIDSDVPPTVEIRDGVTILSNPSDLVITHTGTGKYTVTFTIPGEWTLGDNISAYFIVTLGAFAGSPFRAMLDSFTIEPESLGGSTGTPIVSRAAIEAVFGKANIATWADTDNDQDATTISNRIAWAANKATTIVLGRLKKKYIIPFPVMPSLVVEMICTRAGVELFRSPRGLVEGDVESNQINSINDANDQLIGMVLSGRIEFTDGTYTKPMSVIASVNDCDEQTIICSPSPVCLEVVEIGETWLEFFPDAEWAFE